MGCIMRDFPQVSRRHVGAVRLCCLALCLVCAWWTPLITFARAAAAEDAAEVWYVRGCRDAASRDARETTGCFAAAAGRSNSTVMRSVKLSLQGVHLPTDLHNHRVVLCEHRRPSLLGEVESGAADGAQKMEPVRLLCENPEASELFPGQLITCELVNPLLTMSNNAAWQPHLKRLVNTRVWFDVRVEVQDGGEGEAAYRAVSILRRAVQLRVSNSSKPDAAAEASQKKAQQRAVSWEEVRQHPLERLYNPTAVANDSATSKSARERADTSSSDGAQQQGEEVWVELGIGGLKRELRSLFRRVFLSRLPSLAPLAEALQLQHVRGVILYGPPGNGKTLIARNLFRLLGPNTRLSVVNAADILSKYVGESEKNLRDVFEGYDIGTSSKAEDAAKEEEAFDRSAHQHHHTNNSAPGSLQVLVIDEFEALFRRRGHSADESSAKAVYDGVTNTLLSLMDGVKSRNDLLVVGLTNRLQAIDQALLRPGRFEVLIEIPAPDVPGREDIFFIHTDRLREHHFLAADVDLHTLALESGGFSGSDIAGAVRSAVSYALLRYRQEGIFGAHGDGAVAAGDGEEEEELIGHRPGDVGGWGWTAEDGGPHDVSQGGAGTSSSSAATFAVTRADFDRAMADIRSAKDEASALSQLSTDGDGAGVDVVDYDGTVSRNIERASAVMSRVLQSDRTVSGLIAITGAPGTGKSTIARALTRVHDFTTVRYFSCRRLSELRDREEQLAKLRDALSEASHTDRGLVVLDDYDVLVDAMGSSSSYATMTLRGLLYEYMHRPGGVSRALVADSPLASAEDAGGETEAGNMVVNAGSRVAAERNRRVLLLTSSLAAAVQTQSFDVHLRVHPLLRRGAATLLESYRVVDAAHAAAVAAAYPVSMSYRTFLRITDLSLQRWVQQANTSADSDDAAAVTAVELPAFFATSAAMRSRYATLHAMQSLTDFFTITTDEARRGFAAVVRATVANMGLMDPYEGWKGAGDEDEVDDGVEEDEDADGSDVVDGVEEGFDVDAVVGAADELLW